GRPLVAVPSDPFALVCVGCVQLPVPDLHELQQTPVEVHPRLTSHCSDGVTLLGLDRDRSIWPRAVLCTEFLLGSNPVNWTDCLDHVLVKELAKSDLQADQQSASRRD